MLPSFRLIAATFLCGFFVVFAGLRLAASLNDIHEGLPVMAAHAAPVSMTPAADRELRRGLAAVPVMYDLRFAVSTVSPTLVRIAPTVLDRPAPPPAIMPPEDVAKEALPPAAADPEPSQAEGAVAAIQPEAPVAETPAIVIDAPAEPAQANDPAVAAIDPEPARPLGPADLTTVQPDAEIPAPAAKAAAIGPESPAQPEAAAGPLLADPETTGAIEAPANSSAVPDDAPGPPAAVAIPKPRAATSAPRVKIKTAVARKKKRVRNARRTAAAPANAIGSFSNSPSNPFGGQQH